MNCFHPQLLRNPAYGGANLRLHKLGPYIQVDCKKCVACIRKKSRAICFKLDSEAMYSDFPVMWLTLTYNDESCPDQLSREHIKLFMKRLRKKYLNSWLHSHFGVSLYTYLKHRDETPFCSIEVPRLKYWYCGEYGDTFGRPHYHLFLFHFDISIMDHQKIEDCWSYGFVNFGDAEQGSTVYSTLYSFVKLLEEDDHDVPPFCVSSTGLGLQWLVDHLDYILSHPDRPYLERNHIKYPFPDSYKRWLKENYDFCFDLDSMVDFLSHNRSRFEADYRKLDSAEAVESYNHLVSVIERNEISKLLRTKKHLNG